MLKRIVGSILVVVLALVTMVGSSSGAEPIRIGAPLPLTGPQAAFGEILSTAYTMAAEAINAAGGVNGRMLELLIVDHQGQPELAMSAVERMILRDNVPLLLGGYATATAFAMGQVAERNRIPYIIDIASANRITRQGWEWVFRFSWSSSMAMNGPFAFMESVGNPESIAVVYENSTFGVDTFEAVELWAERQNVEISFAGGFNPGVVDFRPILSRVRDVDADIVILIAYVTDAVLLMRQSQELDINPNMFIGAGAGFAVPEFAAQAGVSAHYVASASIWQPDLAYPGIPEFVAKWEERTGTAPSYHAAAGYASIYLIRDVLERAASLSNVDIHKALRETDLWTVYGRIHFTDFDGYTNQNIPIGVMAQWFDDTLHTIWPSEYAGRPFTFPVPSWDDR